MTFSLIKGGRGGGQGGNCTARGPQGGYGGMGYPQSPYGNDPMQAQYGAGMGYNQGCPTSPCGGDPMQAQYGGGMGYNQAFPTSPSGGNQYGGGGMVPGTVSMSGDPYGNQYTMGQDQYGMGSGAMRNANCPQSGCPRDTPGNGNGRMPVSGNGGNGNGGGFQVPCLECGQLPNPACRLPGQGNGGNGSIGGVASMMTPCLECGGIPNPPCLAGGGGGGGAGGMGLTPCQECGGMSNPPCGMGTCGGATPCAECSGNPNAPCLNMGPCDFCPEPPPPVDDNADKEVFVLKIGKKREGTDKKPRMELELITPKAPVVKPIPKLETREAQYDSKDINGKKGKNGKKKKK